MGGGVNENETSLRSFLYPNTHRGKYRYNKYKHKEGDDAITHQG